MKKSAKLKAELKELHKQQATKNESTENWYDYMTDLISKFMNANAKFVNGDIVDKKEILLAIGQNPVLLDRKLQITPSEWLIPLRDNTKRFVEQLNEVRTMSQQMKKSLLEALSLEWYPGRDSTYLRQARKNIFENKFSRVYFLTKVHWTFSPRPFLAVCSHPPQYTTYKTGRRDRLCMWYPGRDSNPRPVG